MLMKFGHFMSCYKRKKFLKKLYKNEGLKNSTDPFCICKELSRTSIGKYNFLSKLLILDM